MILAISLALLSSCAAALGAESHGLGEAYTWVPFEDAFSGTKPVMLVATKSYCGACKSLKPQFAASPDILSHAEHFTFVSVGDEFAETDSKFAPDGGYIPRILFFHADGTPMTDITGPNAQYKHFFSSPDQIVAAMVQAVKKDAIFKSEEDKDDL